MDESQAWGFTPTGREARIRTATELLHRWHRPWSPTRGCARCRRRAKKLERVFNVESLGALL